MRSLSRLLLLSAVVAPTASCGDVVRQGRSAVFLVMDSLQGARGGATAGSLAGNLLSDVLTLVTTPAPCSATSPCATVFDDSGQVVLHLTPKDAALAPTTNNQVTITRYRVVYRRADGRNTPGVDVPYSFDGAVTGLVPASGSVALGFELVRHAAKQESPLVQLGSNPTIINTIADVTFYGRDQVGSDISVTGSISIEFGNFGD